MTMETQKMIAVVGPTSSGKSELAVRLARAVGGEIVSCDSRQVYRGMDIGTGKVPGSWNEDGVYVYKKIPHHCIDHISPRSSYSAARFQKDAYRAIASIRKRGRIPILCGGTGHWVDAVALNQRLPDIKPDKALRAKLSALPIEVLYEKLQRLDPERARVIDWHNPRRLIRALEIVLSTGRPVPRLSEDSGANVLWLGLYPGQDVLFAAIERRLKQRLRQGLVPEVKKLHSPGRGKKIRPGVSWKKLESFGLEYKFAALYLQGKMEYADMAARLLLAIQHYAKRQMTWFRKNDRIRWITSASEAVSVAREFLAE